MVYAKSVRPILVAALVGLLPACGPALNSNFEAATDEASSSDVVMMTGEQFLFALSEDQSEVESLGLKGKKEKKQAKKAKASAQKSKKVGVAAQAKKAAKANRKEAKEALKRAENLQTAQQRAASGRGEVQGYPCRRQGAQGKTKYPESIRWSSAEADKLTCQGQSKTAQSQWPCKLPSGSKTCRLSASSCTRRGCS
jgi:hypothetical protein